MIKRINNEVIPGLSGVTFDPELACGGVWSRDEHRYTSVRLKEETFTDPDLGFSIYEYVDERGEVRASLLDIPAGGNTPIWELKVPNYDYIEVHQVIAGNGEMIIKPNKDDDTRSGYDLNPVTGQKHFDVRSAIHPLIQGELTGIILKPGEAFQMFADTDQPLRVLATFPQKAFNLAGEQRVSSWV